MTTVDDLLCMELLVIVNGAEEISEVDAEHDLRSAVLSRTSPDGLRTFFAFTDEAVLRQWASGSDMAQVTLPGRTVLEILASARNRFDQMIVDTSAEDVWHVTDADARRALHA